MACSTQTELEDMACLHTASALPLQAMFACTDSIYDTTNALSFHQMFLVKCSPLKQALECWAYYKLQGKCSLFARLECPVALPTSHGGNWAELLVKPARDLHCFSD